MSVLERIITDKHRRRKLTFTPKPEVKLKPPMEDPPDYTEIVFTLRKHLNDLTSDLVADAPPVLEQQLPSPRAENIARLIRKKSQIENRVK